MSTRGLLAFRFEGLDYVTYNHSDSFPRALGRRIVHFAQERLNGREAIAAGKVSRIVHGRQLFRTCLDCEFAYILDLDAGVLEFWELPERAESFPLDSISVCAVDVMESGRRR
jgi:hypothetical protein